MKIGMVSEFYYPQPGGVGEHIRAVSRELGVLGHDVVVLTSHIRGDVQENGPRVERVGRSLPIRYNGSLSRISVGWGLKTRLRRILNVERFDLLHVHNPLMPTLPLLALETASCPVVATFHSCYYRDLLLDLFRVPLRRLLGRVEARVAVSVSALRAAGRVFPGDYSIVPNGVDYECFARAAALRPKREGTLPRKHRLLFVGAMVWRKGLPTLIHAFVRLRAWRDDVELLVVGDGPQMDRMRRMVPSDLRRSVRFFGCVPRPQLVESYAAADLLCAPSLGQESFGMVLLEAMAAGLPVVASDIDGYRNVLTHGIEGLLVPSGDPEAWARTLHTFLDRPDEMERCGHRGQLKASTLGWRSIAQRLDGIYREVLGLPQLDQRTELSFGKQAGVVLAAREAERG